MSGSWMPIFHDLSSDRVVCKSSSVIGAMSWILFGVKVAGWQLLVQSATLALGLQLWNLWCVKAHMMSDQCQID